MFVIRSEHLRRMLQIVLPCAAIPALVALGAFVFPQQSALLIALGVAVMALFVFNTGFENGKTGSRRLVLVSIITTLCIVGRFIPLFKPVTALTVLAGVWTVLWYAQGFNLRLYSAAVVTALPHTLLYAALNLIFLYLSARPIGEKLARVRKKHGV